MEPPTNPDVDRQLSNDFAQRRIPDDDITRFFLTVCSSAKCEMCGSRQWRAASHPEKYSVISAIDDGDVVTMFAGRGHIAINIFCDVCGNLKLFLAEHIERWITENPSYG